MADQFDSPAGATQFDWEEVAKAFQAERDQLDQQVEALLSAVEAHRERWAAQSTETDHALYDVAESVTKEREGK